MKLSKLNLFMMWFLIPLTFVLGWVAFLGRMLLEVLGVSTVEGSVPGIVVGMLLTFAVVFTVQHLRGDLWPVGIPKGKGYLLGNRLLLVANVLALIILTFRLGGHMLSNPDIHLLVDGFTDAFGYWVMAMWAISISLLYQSSLPESVKENS